MGKSEYIKPRKKPIQKRSKETVDAIYEAALQLFTTRGYRETTTDKIAERAGVSIGTLYQYFPNKESILVDMWEQVFDAVVIGGTTLSLSRPEIVDEMEKAHESDLSDALASHPFQCDGINYMEGITGLYSGDLSGTVGGSFFNIKHEFKVHSTWVFDVGKEHLKLDIEDLPILNKISGKGTVDPRTGLSRMVFKVPILGKMPGTGRIDGDKNMSFHISRVDFLWSGHLAEDGSVTGTWGFDFTFVFARMYAKGNMAGALLDQSIENIALESA